MQAPYRIRGNTAAVTSDSSLSEDLDVLARRGVNDKVAEKKALLSMLARKEAERLDILPGPAQVQAITGTFIGELGLEPESAARWLEREGLGLADLEAIMTDFASVLAVESHYRDKLAEPAENYRRLIAARGRRLSGEKKTP